MFNIFIGFYGCAETMKTMLTHKIVCSPTEKLPPHRLLR